MTDTARTLLLVDDDAAIRTFLADNLTADGYHVLVADTARDALRQLEYKTPDLALIDVGLPDSSGLEILRRVRRADGVATRLDPGTPLIVLSGRTTELDRIRGLEHGADDYVSKPFSYPELRLRIAGVLARAHGTAKGGRIRVGELEIDPASRDVILRGRRVELAQKEFSLLRTLATQPARVFTKDELLRDVWGFRAMGTTRTVDSHACRLRQKLAVDGDRFVHNVWGVGYRLVDAAPAGAGR